ncbi:hypothetical protein [Polluticoccus soli]|uniref:hypothetical protein n=1 Tax=Polluticoccus soli TaxID=3034150 RepID=UPI0023E1A8BA|nr:hypothetical protein [Flavipsychrobacter sp. JY13-12]
MKKWTMALGAGLLLFTTATVNAKPDNANKQHQKAWIQQHKMNKQQEKFQKEQYKAYRKQQKEYEKQQRMANGTYGDDDYGYRNNPQNSGKRNYPENVGKRQQPQPQQNTGWNLGDILGGLGI